MLSFLWRRWCLLIRDIYSQANLANSDCSHPESSVKEHNSLSEKSGHSRPFWYKLYRIPRHQVIVTVIDILPSHNIFNTLLICIALTASHQWIMFVPITPKRVSPSSCTPTTTHLPVSNRSILPRNSMLKRFINFNLSNQKSQGHFQPLSFRTTRLHCQPCQPINRNYPLTIQPFLLWILELTNSKTVPKRIQWYLYHQQRHQHHEIHRKCNPFRPCCQSSSSGKCPIVD